LNFEEKVLKNLKLKSDKAVEDGRKRLCVERKREERLIERRDEESEKNDRERSRPKESD
jgi:hypothetical protein